MFGKNEQHWARYQVLASNLKGAISASQRNANRFFFVQNRDDIRNEIAIHVEYQNIRYGGSALVSGTLFKLHLG
jgi:hypothetical protein